ncbi:MAG: sodium:solute symporter [Bacteroidetes bacterium]|nr:sodium:solute symporter [Bacteroidota bacterium]
MQTGWLLVIILAYFALLLGIAFYTSRHSDNESFFIGNRSSKWWVVAFGMIGTSLSGMTFISVPGTVLHGGLNYFQLVIGFWLGYFAVAFVLLPLYYRLQLTSIYSYLDQRLGRTSYKTGATFFILSRTLGATLRLYLVIKVLELFVLDKMGISFEVTSVAILLLILLYTFRGGVKTIVWTDTLQTTFMLLGLIVCVGYILHELNYSIPEAWSAMTAKGYTQIFHYEPMKGNFFLKQVLGGAFITIAMTGLDQEMMQKNISVKNLADSQKNMITFCFILLAVNLLFLLLGGLLYLHADAVGWSQVFEKGFRTDDIFPMFAMGGAVPFIITVCFLIGLISALFPSADGALTALTSSFCIDILGFKRAAHQDEQQQKRTRLIVHISFSIVFLACVFFFRIVDKGTLIDTLMTVAGYTYGPLLALFSIGILTKRMLREKLVPVVCLAAPIICYLLKQHDGSKGAAVSWLGNYVIGNELLIINAGISFVLLMLISYAPKQAALLQK